MWQKEDNKIDWKQLVLIFLMFGFLSYGLIRIEYSGREILEPRAQNPDSVVSGQWSVENRKSTVGSRQSVMGTKAQSSSIDSKPSTINHQPSTIKQSPNRQLASRDAQFGRLYSNHQITKSSNHQIRNPQSVSVLPNLPSNKVLSKNKQQTKSDISSNSSVKKESNISAYGFELSPFPENLHLDAKTAVSTGNKITSSSSTFQVKPRSTAEQKLNRWYQVKVGYSKDKNELVKLIKTLKDNDFYPQNFHKDEQGFLSIPIGEYVYRYQAEANAAKLKQLGFSPKIVLVK